MENLLTPQRLSEEAINKLTQEVDSQLDNIEKLAQQSLNIGDKIPDFTAQATSSKDIQLSALAGYPVVLFFYPKDNTPGCTLEGQDFTKHYDAFKEKKTCVFGISRDNLSSHERFKSKFSFPFELISDPVETLCNLFGVMKLKNMYGRQVMGVERSTFLIDANSCLANEWRKVKVEGHVEAVLEAVNSLN